MIDGYPAPYDWKAAATRADANGGNQNGPTVYEQGSSRPIPASDTSPPPSEPKGPADVRSIFVIIIIPAAMEEMQEAHVEATVPRYGNAMVVGFGSIWIGSDKLARVNLGL